MMLNELFSDSSVLSDSTDCSALPQSYTLFAYRGTYIPLLCSYCGVSQGHETTSVQAQVVSVFCILLIRIPTDCYVLRTLAILPRIRISRDYISLLSSCGAGYKRKNTLVRAQSAFFFLTLVLQVEVSIKFRRMRNLSHFSTFFSLNCDKVLD